MFPRRLPAPTQILGYTLGGALMGPWSLHSLALHLYPRLREELRKQHYPEATHLPLFWWVCWLIAPHIGILFTGESHALAAAVLYILSGWLQAVFHLFITCLYPQGLPSVEPGYRHYKLNECLELWLPLTIGLPLLLVAAGCNAGTCLGCALLIPLAALFLYTLKKR